MDQQMDHQWTNNKWINKWINNGLTNGSTYRFRGAPTTSGTYGDPDSFDGIAGSNIAYASGYAITTGK